MQLVALRDWYPRFGDWTGTLIPQSDRVGWVIHHTVGGTGQDPRSYARGVADYHYGKWRVPGGYNYLVGEDGVVRVMCGLSFQGVHSGTHEWNRKSLGLAFQGDFRNSPPSDVMLEAAAELIADTPIPTEQWGHRDVRPEPTTCPGGELYDLLPLEDTMPTVEEIAKEIWFTKYTDHVTGDPQFAITHLRKAREDANEALINSRTILRAIEQTGSIDLSAEDLAAIREGVAAEVAAEFAERLGG